MPESSLAVVPLASSKPKAATRPVSTLLTLTSTGAEVVVLPSLSRATAVSRRLPLATLRLFQVTWKGAAVSSAPMLAPSTLNCTPARPRSSAALAVTATSPVTVAPAAGAVSETVGGAPLSTVTATCVDVVALPGRVARDGGQLVRCRWRPCACSSSRE